MHPVTRGDEHSASTKYSLASQINRLLDQDKLSQLAAAERLGTSQSKFQRFAITNCTEFHLND